MPRFVFELQPVLTQRSAIERQKRLALAALESERGAMEAAIRGFHEEAVLARVEWSRQLLPAGERGPADLRGARMQAGASLRLLGKAQHAVLKLAGIHKRMEHARAELLEASKRKRAVELLRERRLEEWKLEQRRLEAAAIDEFNVVRFGRTEELS